MGSVISGALSSLDGLGGKGCQKSTPESDSGSLAETQGVGHQPADLCLIPSLWMRTLRLRDISLHFLKRGTAKQCP